MSRINRDIDGKKQIGGPATQRRLRGLGAEARRLWKRNVRGVQRRFSDFGRFLAAFERRGRQVVEAGQ